MSNIKDKDVSLSSNHTDIKFKCTNLTELRDEEIYGKIKTDTQREYLLLVFLYNIVCFYIDNCINYKTNGQFYDTKVYELDNDIYLKKEVDGFIDFIKLESNHDKMLQGIFEYKKFTIPYDSFLIIFNLYDDNFNSKIILEKLCDIKITNEQYYSIIIYYLDKQNYLWDIIEPNYNTRSIIIKNYFKSGDPSNPRGNLLSLKDSNSVDYELNILGGKSFFYIFDKKFKNDIINNNFNDGYDFYWNEHDENSEKKNKENCIKYLVEILDPVDNQIISMTVTRTPREPKKQIHYYIKKNIITQTKNFINDIYQYKNISLLLHSFSTWIFNVDEVYSNLHVSMRYIFNQNGINVSSIEVTDEYNELSKFCIRQSGEKIIINEDFRNLWKNKKEVKLYNNGEFIKLYQLEPNQLEPYFTAGTILNDTIYIKKK